MLKYENSLNPDARRKEWVELLSRVCTDTIAPSPEILTLARRVMKLSKLSPRDALHLACAEDGRCDYLITCDDALIRRVQTRSQKLRLKVKAINPVEFIRYEAEGHGKGKSDRNLLDSGIKALVDALGYSGAARFLRHFSKGNGDYLLVQEKIFKGMKLEQIYKKAKEHHQSNKR